MLRVAAFCIWTVVWLLQSAQCADAATWPEWAKAAQRSPMSATETKQFMRRLAQFVFDNHLKKDPGSMQRGLVYEYLWMPRKGQVDQFIEGEALDTMHDGAWFAAALAQAYRATGDRIYKDILTQWQLPFYLKMLNHSDQWFNACHSVAKTGTKPWGKEWALQEGEKGFVPYWWDDGASVSLERRVAKDSRPAFPATDNLADKPNPDCRLDGYSHGMSNHLAQDLGVMLLQAWLLLKDSDEPADRKLTAELVEACRNLHANRMRHHGIVPMCAAPLALVTGDVKLLATLAATSDDWVPQGHYYRLLYAWQPGKVETTPGFSDDQEYFYYQAVARHGDILPAACVFRTIYDAYTAPLLFRAYCDDGPPPPGINRFDLASQTFRDGQPIDFRSEGKGPRGGPRPIGSRFGTQNMVCSGWALQLLRANSDVWDQPASRCGDRRLYLFDPLPGSQAPARPTHVRLGAFDLSMLCRRDRLEVSGSARGAAPWAFTLGCRAQSKGADVRVALVPGLVPRVVDAQGETLLAEGNVRATAEGAEFELSLPFSSARGQRPWGNAIEHGRCWIAAGGESVELCVASEAKQVEARLLHELAGGLRTWEAIFDSYGYIPTGIGCYSVPIAPNTNWDQFSDTGGYAHLLSAAAQWLMCLEGRRDAISGAVLVRE